MLLVTLQGGVAGTNACCGGQAEIKLPLSIECKVPANTSPVGSCKISSLDICKAINDANRDNTGRAVICAMQPPQ
jgi:hypothetical protein